MAAREAEDRVQIDALFEHACGLGSALGCYEQGRILLRPPASRPRDPTAARRRFERACELGSTRGCAALATLRYLGVGGPKDVDRAAGGFERACRAGIGSACTRLGVLYAHGAPRALIQANSVKATSLYLKACIACHGRGCRLAARRLAQQGNDAATVKDLHDRACRLGVTQSCTTAPAAPGSPPP